MASRGRPTSSCCRSSAAAGGAAAPALLLVIERQPQQLIGRVGQEAGAGRVGGEKPLHLRPESGVSGARGVEKRRPLRRRSVQGLLEEAVHLVPSFDLHRSSSLDSSCAICLVCLQSAEGTRPWPGEGIEYTRG